MNSAFPQKLMAKMLVGALAILVAGTTAEAAKFVKNANVGGYRIVVEGGGVEKRKEVQYDSHGNIVWRSENTDLNQLEAFRHSLDKSLLGGDDFELELDPSASVTLDELEGEEVDSGAMDLEIIDFGGNENSAGTAEENPFPVKKSRVKKVKTSPWVATREIRREQQKFAAEERKRAAEELAKKEAEAAGTLDVEPEETGEIFLDPTANKLSGMKTDDGRELPFYLSGSGTHSEEVDGTATLRNYNKISEKYDRGNANGRFEKSFEIEENEQYDNVISFGQWHSKFSGLGQKRYENVPESPSFLQKIFGRGNERNERFSEKSSDLGARLWLDGERKTTSVTVNQEIANKLIEKYRQTSAFSTELLLPNPNQAGISMQGINRYLFRRSHSDEPGLPAIKPGEDKIEIRKQ